MLDDGSTGPLSTIYPDPAVHTLDPRFIKYRLFNAGIEKLASGTRWGEGPVWFGDARCLLWSDIPNDRILRWDETTSAVSVFRHPSGNANGNARDRTGRLVTCEHSTRRVTRTEYDGSITVIVDRFQGKRLNSPNDVVVASDGAIWFTDPPFGLGSFYEGTIAEPELNANIYRVDPLTGEAAIAADDVLGPNGLCFSPDREAPLYRRVPRGTEPQDPRVRRDRWALSRGQPGADRRRRRNAGWFSL
jgi:gluconolactonase